MRVIQNPDARREDGGRIAQHAGPEVEVLRGSATPAAGPENRVSTYHRAARRKDHLRVDEALRRSEYPGTAGEQAENAWRLTLLDPQSSVPDEMVVVTQ